MSAKAPPSFSRLFVTWCRMGRALAALAWAYARPVPRRLFYGAKIWWQRRQIERLKAELEAINAEQSRREQSRRGKAVTGSLNDEENSVTYYTHQ